MTTDTVQTPLFDLHTYLHSVKEQVELCLSERISHYCEHHALKKPMHYAVFSGGKRLRPAIVYLAGASLGVADAYLDWPACAVEILHCYSLVHDDLPQMDNDDWRRGRPTCHKAFDETTAILAGDALQALAFQLLIDNPFSEAQQKSDMVASLASSALDMVHGQTRDMQATHTLPSIAELIRIHEQKTASLMRACFRMATIAAQVPINLFDQFAIKLGLAFQIQDDILDVETEQNSISHTDHSSTAYKATFPNVIGLDASKMALADTYQDALEHLPKLSATALAPLKALAHCLVYRQF